MLQLSGMLILAAGLGFSMGVMRHPIWGGTSNDILDFGLKYNEVERALHWQCIAPPFGLAESQSRVSEELLIDWTETLDGPEAKGWLANFLKDGKKIYQSAPAIITRNMRLPVVKALEEEKPFVAASIHPKTGALSIAVIPRTIGERKLYTPKADIRISLPDFQKPAGVFGKFGKLYIESDENMLGRIFLQDLCRKEAIDITEMVKISNNLLVVDFERLSKKGWLDNDIGDKSEPGFLLQQINS